MREMSWRLLIECMRVVFWIVGLLRSPKTRLKNFKRKMFSGIFMNAANNAAASAEYSACRTEEDLEEALPKKSIYFYYKLECPHVVTSNEISATHHQLVDEKANAQDVLLQSMKYLPRKVREQGVVFLSLWYAKTEEFPAIQRVPSNSPGTAYEIKLRDLGEEY